MRALVVVVVDPVLESTAGIGERGEHRLLEKLPPDRLPETLDLAQRHRVLRRTADVLHALLAQHLLEPRFSAPGHKLPPVVGKNLAGSAPLPNGSLQHLEDGVGILLPKQSPARQIAGVVVQDADEVHRVHPLQLKREDVDLPHRVRTRSLETSSLRRTSSGPRRWVTQARFVDHRTDLLRAHLDAFVTSEVVADSPDAVVGILPATREDLLLQNGTLSANRDRRRLAAQSLHTRLGVVLPPLVDRPAADADQLADLDRG